MQSQSERMEGNAEINEGHLEELSASESKRNELQNLIREGIDEGVKLRDEIEKKLNELVSENKQLQKQVKA